MQQRELHIYFILVIIETQISLVRHLYFFLPPEIKYSNGRKKYSHGSFKFPMGDIFLPWDFFSPMGFFFSHGRFFSPMGDFFLPWDFFSPIGIFFSHGRKYSHGRIKFPWEFEKFPWESTNSHGNN